MHITNNLLHRPCTTSSRLILQYTNLSSPTLDIIYLSNMTTVTALSRFCLVVFFAQQLMSSKYAVSAFSTPTKTTVVSRRQVDNNFSTVFSQKQQISTIIESGDGIIANNPPLSEKKTTTATTDDVTSKQSSSTMFASLSLAIALTVATATTAITTTPQAAYAYIPSDYASDTVQTVIQDLKKASGNGDETFKVYESIAGIITEGKGVGGMVNFKGIELERGYVADEDTTIYNPGLSLLTGSEKERLVEAVIDARKEGLAAKGQWSENNDYAYDFLRQKLDPYHMVELSGFFKFVPFYGAFLYLGVLGVQQLFRGAFQVAYLTGVAAFILPIIALIAAGP